MADVTRLFPIELSWVSHKFLVNGVRYDGFKGLSYSFKRNVTVVKGSRSDAGPVGMTRGSNDGVEGKISLLSDTAMLIKAQLAALGALALDPLSYGSAWFQMIVVGYEPGHPLPLNYTFTNCRLTSEDLNWQEGDEPSIVELGYKAMKGSVNGLSLASGLPL